MDFIERIFRIFPDGGSGLLELALFLIPIVGIVAIHGWRRARRSPTCYSDWQVTVARRL